MTSSSPTIDTFTTARVPLSARRGSEIFFQVLALFATTFAIVVLIVLLVAILSQGIGRIDYAFLTSFPSRHAEKAGILAALVGSGLLMVLVAIFSFPLGVGAALYLEEYASKNFFTKVLEINLANLAGVPSIIYGLLGLQIFVRMFMLDRSLLAGALTLTLLILPIIIIASREALRTVPVSIREGAMALGASKWQTTYHHVLPMAMPGVMTGCILAFSRAIGETAPLVTLGALTYIAFIPDETTTLLAGMERFTDVVKIPLTVWNDLLTPFTALPIQAFNWVSRPQSDFHVNAAGAITVLLIVLLSLNALAIFLRLWFQRRIR